MCLALVAVVAVIGTVTTIGLYADGAQYLLAILQHPGVFLGAQPRPFISAVTQLPVLAGLACGVHDLRTLAVLQSTGLVALPCAVWMWALLQHRTSRLFWHAATMWAVTFLVSGFFAVGEYNLTYALVGLAASLLLTECTAGRALVVAAVGLVLLRSYQSMVFLGPALAGLALLARRPETSPVVRRVLVVDAALFVAAALWTLPQVFGAHSMERVDQATDVVTLVRDPALVTAGVAVVGHALRSRRLLLVPMSALVVVFALTSVRAAPWDYYNARIAAGALLLPVMLSAVLAARRPRDRSSAWLLPTAAVVALTAVFVGNCLAFAGWLDDFRNEVRGGTGVVAYENTALGGRYVWGWTNPALSVLLRSRPGQELVANPADYSDSWEPFDPATMDTCLSFDPCHRVRH